ncbi:hypothetical protein ES332_A08G274200v1 [Gossypium tomentosum]|uniref:Uncharacterized protein n=2 Tax=Gossypium tomentosum TaxID=34277 RepID=A0A5D2PNB9_GOSTO|nr:hypothetical protein ES332_A08G274200v1 [Gossypium tomentosum]
MWGTKRWFILHQRRKGLKQGRKSMRKRLNKLKTEMKVVSKEQKSIKEGQRQAGAKLQAINYECEQLRRETNRIIQQTATTQIRLALMFNILKAREECDFAKAHQLTALLREIVARG